jgi:Mg-chelatase subunit ChlI
VKTQLSDRILRHVRWSGPKTAAQHKSIKRAIRRCAKAIREQKAERPSPPVELPVIAVADLVGAWRNR